MASISTTYWQLLLSQGVCMGLGFGLMFSPALSLIPTYFTTRRSLAVGLGAAGSAMGGLIFPAVVQTLLPTIGYAWTMRVLGFLTLSMLLPSFFLFRQRVPPRRSGPIVEWVAFREKAYVFFSVGMYLNYWGLYIAFFYITSFAHQIIGFSEKASIDLLLILNGVGMFARTIPNFIADRRTGPLNLLMLSTLMSSVMLLCWIAVSTPSGLYAFVVFYGIFSAGTQSLFPATLASITDDMKKIGVKLGMVMTILSFATLTGNPIAGALLARDHGGYLYAQLFAALTMLAGTVLITIARFCRTGLVLRAKV
jgi:predicted MFS family arabinose efflux permease